MTAPDEKLLKESAWLRARRDTWPSGWWRKLGKRALIAFLALSANYAFAGESDRDGLVQAATIGLGSFFFADVVLYPLNVLLSPRRQRDELRVWAERSLSKSRVTFSIRAAVIRGSGDVKIIDVSNPGDVTVRDIEVLMPESTSIFPINWRIGDVVVKELAPGERASIPFFLRRSMGSNIDSVRVELRGMAGTDVVMTTTQIDPLRL